MSSQGISAEAAALERIRREKARRELIDFSCYVAPFYRPARHHRLVAEYLLQVLSYIETKGEDGIGRLMIFEPFRHGKTEQVSRLFPAFVLGKLPDSRVILTSYGADLAQDDSRAVRNYVTCDRFQALFGSRAAIDEPVELSDDSRSRSNWNLATPHRGGVVAAGVGGGITGKGAHLLVVDDPFKNRDEAESEAYRKRVMSWWRSSAYTRLEDGGAIVMTHTRWHPEDLAGQLLTEMASDPLLADQWTVLFLPMLALAADEYSKDEAEFQRNLLRGLFLPARDPLGRKPGEALWAEKYNEAAVARIRRNIGEAEFMSLGQQLPRPASGGFFDESDFEIVERAPEGLRWVRYVDLALGESVRADWNATAAEALDESDGYLYVRDMLRVRELTEFMPQVASWMLSDLENGVVWGFEAVNFQTLVMREFLKDKRLAKIPIMPVTPQGDKVSRARAIQTRGKQGLVRLVRGAWNQAFIAEALSFPRGAHDDQIDTVSGGLQMISDDAGDGAVVVTEPQVVMADSLF